MLGRMYDGIQYRGHGQEVVETLAQYARQLEPYAKEAESRCCRLQRLYLSMGILGGLMAAVLLA